MHLYDRRTRGGGLWSSGCVAWGSGIASITKVEDEEDCRDRICGSVDCILAIAAAFGQGGSLCGRHFHVLTDHKPLTTLVLVATLHVRLDQ